MYPVDGRGGVEGVYKGVKDQRFPKSWSTQETSTAVRSKMFGSHYLQLSVLFRPPGSSTWAQPEWAALGMGRVLTFTLLMLLLWPPSVSLQSKQP